MQNGGRVGVRELRQNLSVYLRRVEAGETLTVTDRRRPVAVLAPLPDDPLERRLTELGAIRARRDLIANLPPPIPVPPGVSIAEILDDVREDRV